MAEGWRGKGSVLGAGVAFFLGVFFFLRPTRIAVLGLRFFSSSLSEADEDSPAEGVSRKTMPVDQFSTLGPGQFVAQLDPVVHVCRVQFSCRECFLSFSLPAFLPFLVSCN